MPQKPELSLVLILKAVFCDTFFVGSVPMGMCKNSRPKHFLGPFWDIFVSNFVQFCLDSFISQICPWNYYSRSSTAGSVPKCHPQSWYEIRAHNLNFLKSYCKKVTIYTWKKHGHIYIQKMVPHSRNSLKLFLGGL